MSATTSGPTVPPPATAAPTTITVANDSKLQITALSGAENWKVWKMRIMDWLDEKDMVDIIKTAKPSISSTSPIVTADDIKLWENQNKKALANIRRNVTDSIADDLVHLTTAKDVWERLCQKFEVEDFIRIVTLRRQFFGYRMPEGSNVNEHLQKMRQYFDDLRGINTDYATSLDWAITFPASLPDSWDIFVQTLQHDLDD
jgi:hypothetical protein